MTGRISRKKQKKFHFKRQFYRHEIQKLRLCSILRRETRFLNTRKKTARIIRFGFSMR